MKKLGLDAPGYAIEKSCLAIQNRRPGGLN